MEILERTGLKFGSQVTPYLNVDIEDEDSLAERVRNQWI